VILLVRFLAGRDAAAPLLRAASARSRGDLITPGG
jgi:hypothetical protein